MLYLRVSVFQTWSVTHSAHSHVVLRVAVLMGVLGIAMSGYSSRQLALHHRPSTRILQWASRPAVAGEIVDTQPGHISLGYASADRMSSQTKKWHPTACEDVYSSTFTALNFGCVSERHAYSTRNILRHTERTCEEDWPSWFFQNMNMHCNDLESAFMKNEKSPDVAGYADCIWFMVYKHCALMTRDSVDICWPIWWVIHIVDVLLILIYITFDRFKSDFKHMAILLLWCHTWVQLLLIVMMGIPLNLVRPTHSTVEDMLLWLLI